MVKYITPPTLYCIILLLNLVDIWHLSGDYGMFQEINMLVKCFIKCHLIFQLEAGSTREIYLPIVPKIIRGDISFTVAASSAIGNDTVARQVKVLVSSPLSPNMSKFW